MKRKAVAPKSVFDSNAYGFSQGILVGGGKKILYISGQLAANRQGKFVGGSFRDQCKMALDGIDAVLKEAGGTKKNVARITAYVTDMKGSIEEFTNQTKRFFPKPYPASTLIEVRGLAFPGQVVEIEAIATI